MRCGLVGASRARDEPSPTAWYREPVGDDSLTVEILKQIRDELKGVRVELGEVRDETCGNGVRLDRTNERLDRVVQEQIRHSTAIVGLEARMGDMATAIVRLVGEIQGLNRRVDNVLTGPVGSTVRDTSARVDRLEERMAAAEKKIG